MKECIAAAVLFGLMVLGAAKAVPDTTGRGSVSPPAMAYGD